MLGDPVRYQVEPEAHIAYREYIATGRAQLTAKPGYVYVNGAGFDRFTQRPDVSQKIFPAQGSATGFDQCFQKQEFLFSEGGFFPRYAGCPAVQVELYWAGMQLPAGLRPFISNLGEDSRGNLAQVSRGGYAVVGPVFKCLHARRYVFRARYDYDRQLVP